MVTDALDFHILLLENYKKIKLNEEEAFVILMVDHLIELGNPFIDSNLLALKMALDIKKIDEVLANLITRGFLKYTSEGNKMVTTLAPLKQLLYREFQIALTLQQEQLDNETANKELKEILTQYEKSFGRQLSLVETSKIKEWYFSGVKSEVLIDAIKEVCKKRKNPSLYDVDNTLLYWQSRNDIEIEGHTTISKNWNKGLEETIRIAKTPWLDDEDDE